MDRVLDDKIVLQGIEDGNKIMNEIQNLIKGKPDSHLVYHLFDDDHNQLRLRI